MKCLFYSYCQLLKQVDMFGKEPEFYHKGKPKKTSWVGRIFSIFYFIIYFAFFLYKLFKMLRKIDVIFYDTFTFPPLYSAEIEVIFLYPLTFIVSVKVLSWVLSL